MRHVHAEDLARFVEELKRETDRGLPLVGEALIDEKLLESLQSFFLKGNSQINYYLMGMPRLGLFQPVSNHATHSV